MYEEDNYYVVHGTLSAGPGDGYSPILWVWVFCRSYYSFDLFHLPGDSVGFELIEATLILFQYASHGNDERGVYPIWDFPGGDTNYCYLDHIDYGYELDQDDWTAGDTSDNQTLHPLFSIVSLTPDTGFRYIDVTELVLDDILHDRQKSQFRIHFPIGTDYDAYMDGISFSGITYPALYRRPKLILEYRIPNVGIHNQSSALPDNIYINHTYPNPFNSNITIDYQINKPSKYKFYIFDLTGRTINVLKSDFHPIGQYSIQWNGKTQIGVDVPSGVYFIVLEGKMNSVNRKVVLLR